MKKKKVTLTKQYVDDLKSEITCLKAREAKLETDLEKHRYYYIKLLRITLEKLGKGFALSTSWLAEDLAKHFNNVDKWWWS